MVDGFKNHFGEKHFGNHPDFAARRAEMDAKLQAAGITREDIREARESGGREAVHSLFASAGIQPPPFPPRDFGGHSGFGGPGGFGHGGGFRMQFKEAGITKDVIKNYLAEQGINSREEFIALRQAGQHPLAGLFAQHGIVLPKWDQA